MENSHLHFSSKLISSRNCHFENTHLLVFSVYAEPLRKDVLWIFVASGFRLG